MANSPSITPADLSAQRNAALHKLTNDQKQFDENLAKVTIEDSAHVHSDDEAAKRAKAEAQAQKDAQAVSKLYDLLKANPNLSQDELKQKLSSDAAAQELFRSVAGMQAPATPNAGTGAAAPSDPGTAPVGTGSTQATQPAVAGQLTATPDAPLATPADGSAPTPTPAPTTDGLPAPGTGNPASGDPPIPVPPPNTPLQTVQNIQQMHEMWDQIRNIEGQIDINDRKTQSDIFNMYMAEWQSEMQSAQSNMLSMMAASHGFVAAFIKNYISA